MAKEVVNAAFRCDAEVYESLKDIATKEQRSIGNVINIMVAGQVELYSKGGWPAIIKQENTHE